MEFGSVGFLRDGKTITPREKPLEVTRLKKVQYIHPGQVVFGLRQVTFLASYIFLCDQLHISPYNINIIIALLHRVVRRIIRKMITQGEFN